MNTENKNLQKYLEDFKTVDYETCKGTLKFAFEDMLKIFNEDVQKALHLAHLAAKFGTCAHDRANEIENQLYFHFFTKFAHDHFETSEYAMCSKINPSDIWYLKEVCKDDNNLKKLTLDMIMAFAAVDGAIEAELIEQLTANLNEDILNSKYNSLAKARLVNNLIFNHIPEKLN